MDEMPELARPEAEIIVGNTPDEQLVDLYMAAWNLWRAVRMSGEPMDWLDHLAAVGKALDVEYEAPLLLHKRT